MRVARRNEASNTHTCTHVRLPAASPHARATCLNRGKGTAYACASYRVLAVDDPGSKLAPECLLKVRRWDASNRDDAQLAGLANSLLAHALPLARSITTGSKPPADLRTVVPEVCSAVLATPDRERVRYVATGSDEGYYEEYPVREGAEVCSFYAKSGYCKCAPSCCDSFRVPALAVCARGGLLAACRWRCLHF
jgi:hypothetical protein